MVDRLFTELQQAPGYALTVDLPGQVISTPGGDVIHFEVDGFRKDCLIRGLDDIGLTLEHAGEIRAFEQAHRQRAPWLFDKRNQE